MTFIAGSWCGPGMRFENRIWTGIATAIAAFATVPTCAADVIHEILGPGAPPKAIVIGDSIARGAFAGDRFKATDTFTYRMFQAGVFTTTMARHMGKATRLPRYNDAVEEQNVFDPWKFVLVLLGTNDYSTAVPIEDVADRYAHFLDTAVRSYWYRIDPAVLQTIFCVTPVTRANETARNAAGYSLDDLRHAIRDVCTLRGIPVIDGSTLLPRDPGIRRHGAARYHADGLHLNQFGHQILAAQLLESTVGWFAEFTDNPPPMMSILPETRDDAFSRFNPERCSEWNLR